MAVFDILPFLAMVVVQIGYAGMNTTSKLAMDYSNMKPLILVTYRQVFATITMIPFAYFLERKTRPKITWPLLFQIFLCSLTAIVGNQVLFFVGLQYSDLTTATALTNILPAVTFVLAFLFRQEALGITKLSGQAKVIGTTLCVGGAMMLTFYKGAIINIGESSIRWKYASKTGDDNNDNNSILGPLIVIASTVSWAMWFIILARVSKDFPAPYTNTLLMSLMGTVQCAVIGAGVNRNLSDWALNTPFRLVATLYAGIVCSALAFSLTSWTVQRKGALYSSVFSPLLLIITAIIGWALLRDKIYVGTLVGSVMIVVGLYSVLWGKDKEAKQNSGEAKALDSGNKEETDTPETQLPTDSISNQETVIDIDAVAQGDQREEKAEHELQLSTNSIEDHHVNGSKKIKTEANC